MKPWVPIAALTLALSPLVAIHPVRVLGRSMEPALMDGELVWALRPWCAGRPQRGQMWVVQGPEGSSVKRLVGLPTEHIESKDGELSINGARFREPYVARNDAFNGDWDCREGYLLLGDNRPESHDGRAWGALPRAALQGRVIR